MSVRLWNFKVAGPKMQAFCPRINMLKDFFKNNPAMNYSYTHVQESGNEKIG